MCSSVAGMLLVVGDAHEVIVVELGASPPRGGVGSAHIVRRRGGSAANVAALAADAHAAARYAGQVGLDHAGDFLIEDLEECGVDVCITRQGRTGTAVIVRSGATTTRIVDRATATQCTGFKSAVLDDVTLIHLPASAFSVEPLATAVEDLLGEAIERGIPITIDPGGIRMPSGTSAPAAMIDPVPMWQPFSRMTPIPIRHRSSIVHP